MLHIGIIASAGGASFRHGLEILKSCRVNPQVSVVTDRPCRAESVCDDIGVPYARIEDMSREEFSARAKEWLIGTQDVDFIMLFFGRIVSSELYSNITCVNFHPSLLPSFPGMGAVNKLMNSDARFIGATAHLVSGVVDGGSILAQVVSPVVRPASIEVMERISFAQKVYLFLVVSEIMIKGHGVLPSSLAPSSVKSWANPALEDERLVASFDDFLRRENIPWIR